MDDEWVLGMKKMKDSELDPDVKRRITKICIRTLTGSNITVIYSSVHTLPVRS